MKALLILFALLLTACGGGNESSPQPREMSAPSPQAHLAQATVAPQWTIAIKPRITGAPRPTVAPPPPPPPVTTANPLEGLYFQPDPYATPPQPPGLMIDAQGHFWMTADLICSAFQAGTFTHGSAPVTTDQYGELGCSPEGNGPYDLVYTAVTANGLITVSETYEYGTLSDPGNPPWYPGNQIQVPESGTQAPWAPLIQTPTLSTEPTLGNVAGNWYIDFTVAWELLGLNNPPDHITINPDGTFDLAGCAWQITVEDSAVSVYTLMSDCGTGVLTLFESQIYGGVTINGTLVALNSHEAPIYPNH